MGLILPEDRGLLLDRDMIAFPSPAGTEFHLGSTHLVLKGRSCYELLLVLAPYLDGTLTLSTICTALPDSLRGAGQQFLDWLLQHRFVMDVPATEGTVTVSPDLAYWFRAAGGSKGTRRPDLSSCRVAVAGRTLLALAMTHCLARLQVGHVLSEHDAVVRTRSYCEGATQIEHRESIEPDWRGADALFFTFDNIDDASVALNNKKPLLPLTYVVGTHGQHGIAALSAADCPHCMLHEIRRASAVRSHSGIAPASASMLAQQAALSFARDELGLPRGIAGPAYMRLDLDTLDAALLRFAQPAVPTCGCST